MKTVFPTAACILIAPGDRGILVRRSANIRKKKGQSSRIVQKTDNRIPSMQAPSGKGSRKKPAPKIDLFVYSKIHAQIGLVQAEVAAEAGCRTWSMQDAMGGPGHSYDWARQSPALMSKDLIHFTVAGYQRLAQKFAKDMGWTTLSVRDQ